MCVVVFSTSILSIFITVYIYIHIYCFIRHGFDLDRSMFVKPKSAYVSPEKRLKKSKHFMRERKKEGKREREKKKMVQKVCAEERISRLCIDIINVCYVERERERERPSNIS